MSVARLALGTVGLAVLGFGVLTLVTTVDLPQLLGLALWLAGAVVVHDAILVPAMQLLGTALDRVGRTVPRAARLVVRLGFGLGVVVSLVVLPEVAARARGPRNSSVLAVDYAARLGITWALIVVLTAAAVAVIMLRASRTSRRSGSPAASSGTH